MTKEHRKDQLKKLRSMKEKGLQDLYNETNLIISKVRGESFMNRPVKGDDMKAYQHAKVLRARVLTILKQRFDTRSMRKGYGRNNGNEAKKMSKLQGLIHMEPRRNLQGR